MKKIFLNSAIVLLGAKAVLSLSGCANAALAVTDPRSISTLSDDQYIMRNLQITYMGKEFESNHIQATVYNHEVLLNGQATSLIKRHKIVETAKNMKDVTKVYDYIKVSQDYVSTSTDDTVITGKVKSKLFASEDVNSNDVKIVTSDGVVYILGIIKKEQLNNMLAVTRNVDGVKKVEPLVHYKGSDSKLNIPST